MIRRPSCYTLYTIQIREGVKRGEHSHHHRLHTQPGDHQKGGGSQRGRRREQGRREGYSHKGEGDGNRVQGRVIHTKEKEAGTGAKGGLVSQRGGDTKEKETGTGPKGGLVTHVL